MRTSGWTTNRFERIRADREPLPAEIAGIVGDRERESIPVEPPTEPFPADPNSPPVATFFERGANIPRRAPVHTVGQPIPDGADGDRQHGQSGRQLQANGDHPIPHATPTAEEYPDAQASAPGVRVKIGERASEKARAATACSP